MLDTPVTTFLLQCVSLRKLPRWNVEKHNLHLFTDEIVLKRGYIDLYKFTKDFLGSSL